MNPKKRLLSITLIVVILVALFPAAVLAEDTEALNEEVLDDAESEPVVETDDDLVAPTTTEDVSDIADSDDKEPTIELPDILPETGAEDINTREETELTDLEQELQPASKQLMQAESDNNLIVQNGIKYNIIDADQKLLEVAGFEDKNDSRSELVLPETIDGAETTYTVVSIVASAFRNCKSLSSIGLPNSITDIGANAFEECRRLTTIDLPDSLTSIKNNTFYYCASLTTIDLPESITSIGNRAFYNCRSLTTIKIPESLTSIGANAFEECRGLTTIDLPNSISSIGASAFRDCKNLSEIVLPDGITKLESDIFNGCKSLSLIDLPNSLTSIGSRAFYNCESLTTMLLPDNITEIESTAFLNCRSLTTIILPNSLTSIGSCAFENCISLTTIILPNSLTSIGSRAFENCISLTTIILPNSITNISDYTFYGCSNLTKIEFSDNLISIGDYAFSQCLNLLTIDLPDSLTSIGKRAFRCENLEEVFIGKGLQNIAQDAFYKENGDIEIKYYTNSPRVQLLLLDTLKLAKHPYCNLDGTENVPARAICTVEQDINIEDIIIESGAKVTLDNVTINLEGTLEFAKDTLEGNGIVIMGSEANLTNTLPIGIKAQYYVSKDFPGFANGSNIISAIINADFNKLENVTIDGKLLQKNVDYEAKEGSTIITLLPEYVKTLSNGSYDVKATFTDGFAELLLHSEEKYRVTYTDGVVNEKIFKDQAYRYIEEGTATPSFVGTPTREGYTFVGWKPKVADTVTEDVIYIAQWHRPVGYIIVDEGIEYKVIDSNNKLLEVVGFKNKNRYYEELRISEIIEHGDIDYTTISIGEEAFFSQYLLESVELPNSITRIEQGAFEGCESLLTINLPDRLEFIGDEVFLDCYNLESIKFPDNLQNIGNAAFYKCSSLSDIKFPAKLQNIGAAAFYYCSGISSIDLPDNIKNLKAGTFRNCISLKSINFPNNLKNIDEEVFEFCGNLTEIKLPDSLESIGAKAFGECENLEKVFVGKGLQTIVTNAFYKKTSDIEIEYSTNSPRVQLLLLDELSLAQHPYYAWDGIETIPDRAIGTLDKDITINDAVIELGGKVILDNVTINLEGMLEFAEDTLEGSGTIVMGANAEFSGTLPEGIEAIYYVKEDFPDFLNTDKAISATINADIAKLEGVTIGGQLLQAGVDYNTESGSTIITLLPEYLKTLPYGSYDVGVDFADGYADLSLDIKATYTVTYTDGITDEEIFADQVYEDIKQRDATPVFNGIPERKGYTFIGWEPQVAETVTEDVTYVAQWEQEDPIPTTKPTETVTIKPSQSETAKTDKQTAPKTGESINLMLPIMFIVTAVLLVLSIIVIKKREQDKT